MTEQRRMTMLSNQVIGIPRASLKLHGGLPFGNPDPSQEHILVDEVLDAKRFFGKTLNHGSEMIHFSASGK